MQILVVEDSSTLRFGMQKIISRLGHQAIMANSGEEALQMIGTRQIDLVIMDIELPGLDGYETTMLLRETSLPFEEVARITGLDVYKVVGMKLKMRAA